MPQLNPEFFISQLFWLIITFSFLIIFLWKISLPRINSVLLKRERKINDDIAEAKKNQVEAEEIQKTIDIQLNEAKSKNIDLIKSSTLDFNKNIDKKLEDFDSKLNKKLEDSSTQIEKNKNESLIKINEQIYEITKLTMSKVTAMKINESEIKNAVDSLHKKAVN